jgi:predicted ester cyclase
LGVPPTGKSIVCPFIVFDRIEGDKLVSSEVFVDVAGLLIQFGVMPPPKGF